ncbi:MAG TPA: alpha-1,4-glucan--maltose-1-phosphate maltosyltransferase [Bryobacteraceae bacterium]|nr:alpha-1,4-glucan--maltose-1-phosphate maltosyltransferase [Bryobacteraceae bacterium]
MRIPDHNNGRHRAVVEAVTPQIDGGRFAAKCIAGDALAVEADVFTDGHDFPLAVLRSRRKGAGAWTEVPMSPITNDRWRGYFTPEQPGRYEFTVIGWVDGFRTWHRDLKRRLEASSDTPVDYRIGAALVAAAADRATGDDATWLSSAAARLELANAESRQLATGEALLETMARYPDRRFEAEYERTLEVFADPVRARFSSWYEFFPRSAGTFRDCEERLSYVAEMGFDVLYFPPVHPIGTKFRKGRNNTLTPEPEDVGSPWAIGAPEGGHTAVHPSLGTIEDFRRLVAKASALGIDVALDIAFQASPDHPWVSEHEEWFRKRPDGTIQYAENPPKKYQDIYPFDFESEAWQEMWNSLKGVFDFWIGHGVRIFRVDNPHTKAFPFWEWCLNAIKDEHPDVLFLSEAFTRPKVKYRLAKLGFSQSYTYFPWRHEKAEIEQYFTEITRPPVSDFFRGNHWPNTPDILTEFLQTSGRAGFMQRVLLAGTLAANYGIYGPAYELMDHKPAKPGSEEYLDSEKYQIRTWDLNRSDSLRDLIALLNRIRQENRALHNDTTLRFHQISNEHLIAYSKRSFDGTNLIVTVVNLDPRHRHSGYLELPAAELGLDVGSSYQVHELLTDARYLWHAGRNYIDLDPASVPAHIFRVRRRVRTEREFEYFL